MSRGRLGVLSPGRDKPVIQAATAGDTRSLVRARIEIRGRLVVGPVEEPRREDEAERIRGLVVDG